MNKKLNIHVKASFLIVDEVVDEAIAVVLLAAVLFVLYD